MDNYQVVLEFFKNAEKLVSAGEAVTATGTIVKMYNGKIRKSNRFSKRCY